jgi:hypothetical protein
MQHAALKLIGYASSHGQPKNIQLRGGNGNDNTSISNAFTCHSFLFAWLRCRASSRTGSGAINYYGVVIMTNIIDFPKEVSEFIPHRDDNKTYRITLQFRVKECGQYCDYMPVNPKAVEVTRFARRRYLCRDEMFMLQEIGFNIEIIRN